MRCNVHICVVIVNFFVLSRMLQTLEREPTESMHPLAGHPMVAHGGPHDASPAASRMPSYGVPGSKGKTLSIHANIVYQGIIAFLFSITGYVENGDRRGMRDNPHKYLLYKPSLSQLMVFLSSGFKELPPGGALLLYMSADGCFSTTKHPQDCELYLSTGLL